MKKDNKFFLGMILGAAAGVVAGVFLAPKSGKETREDLKKQGKEAIETTKKVSKKAYLGAKTEGQKFFDKVFRKKNELEVEELGKIEDMKDAADEAKEAAESAVEIAVESIDE